MSGMARPEVRLRFLERDEFCEKYVQKRNTQEDCRYCPYYGRRWSCPPGVPDPLCYLEGYSRICLLVLKVDYPEAVRERAREDSDYVRQIRERHYEAAKGRMLRGLLKIEEEIPGSKTLGAGRCILCENCAREEGKPCRHPRLRRYSFTAFGIDFSELLKEEFQIPIFWASKGLPEYDVAVAALLIK